ISLLLALCSAPRGLFCGRFGRLFSPCFGRFCFRRRSSFGFSLRVRLALGPRCCRLRWFGAAGENLGDANDREFVPIAALAPRILAATLLEGDYLIAARVLEYLTGNGRTRDGRRAELRCVTANDQHLAELDDLARVAIHPVHPDHIFGGDPVLFAASPDDCEHLFRPRVRSRRSDCSGPASFSRFVVCFYGLISPSKNRADPRARAPCLWRGKAPSVKKPGSTW